MAQVSQRRDLILIATEKAASQVQRANGRIPNFLGNGRQHCITDIGELGA